MVTESVKSYCDRIGRMLHHQTEAPSDRDIRPLLHALDKARHNGVAELRLRGVPLRIAQELIALLFPADPDWQFLRAHSNQELIDVAFQQCRAVLEWSITDAAKDEQATPEGVFPFFNEPVIEGMHQQPCTPATAIRRVRLVQKYWQGEDPPAILLLGDDDLVSVAFARVAGWLTTVLEIDQRVIEMMRRAHNLEPQIDIISHDLHAPLPQSLHNRFDIVMADPMYTAEGLEMFLRAAMTAMGNNPDRLLFLSFNDTAVGAAVLQNAIANLEKQNMALIERVPRFSVYPIPRQRYNQLRKASKLFFSNPLMHTMLDLPVAFSDMLVFRRTREQDTDHGT